MTQKEIEKFLAETKVYVNGKSKEIQKKIFSFGFHWHLEEDYIHDTEKPFLYLKKNKQITCGFDMDYFKLHEFREITPDEILSLELTEPSYRPFKDKEECWQEMLKHRPFGWIKNKYGYWNVTSIYKYAGEEKITVSNCSYDLSKIFENHTFADGEPFGIKEE